MAQLCYLIQCLTEKSQQKSTGFLSPIMFNVYCGDTDQKLCLLFEFEYISCN